MNHSKPTQLQHQIKSNMASANSSAGNPIQQWRALSDDARAYAVLDWLIETEQYVKTTPLVRIFASCTTNCEQNGFPSHPLSHPPHTTPHHRPH